jgi:molybdate transport system regulatory protein
MATLVGMNSHDISSRRRPGQPVLPCIATLTLRRKHWIELNGRFAIGEGGAELLQAVDVRGSLAEGARHVGWSYRHAWGYVRRAEAVLGVSLVSTKPGKGSARGTVITDAARHIVATLLPEPMLRRPRSKRTA